MGHFAIFICQSLTTSKAFKNSKSVTFSQKNAFINMYIITDLTTRKNTKYLIDKKIKVNFHCIIRKEIRHTIEMSRTTLSNNKVFILSHYIARMQALHSEMKMYYALIHTQNF